MARRHDDSCQMKMLLQPGVHSDNGDQQLQGSNGARSDRPENVVKPKNGGQSEHSEEAGSYRCPHGCSVCGASCTADVRRRRVEASNPCKEELVSLCCSLEALRKLPQGDAKLGELNFSRTHTVLVDVNFFKCEGRFVPQDGRDLWHSNFVKMPCSQASVMVKSGIMASNQVRQRWTVITKQLKALTGRAEADVQDVAKAVMKYNPKYEKQWTFDGLAEFMKVIPKEENYFRTLFPKMADLALRLPEYVKKALPLLKSGQTAAITLSQRQISCLLANAFFCTFPHRNMSGPNTEYCSYPTINFTSLFEKFSERKKEKLRAIMHYFKEVTETPPQGLVTFERRCLKGSDVPNWRSCKEKLPKLHVTSKGSIEREGTGMLQVDFAASWIGGGVLGSGLLQEEILFLIHPELIVSRLFTEKLEDGECLIVTGCQQFSLYSGFGDSFEWAGPCDDAVPRDAWGRRQRQIVAIDALHFKHRSEQYNMKKVLRELAKAYCGFKKHGHEDSDVATGKWGCGAFNGDPQLKALIQLMAAAKARRGLAFFTFGDEKVKRDLEQMYSLLVREDVTVGKLYGLMEDYCDQHTRRGSHVDLFEFISNTFRSSRSQL